MALLIPISNLKPDPNLNPHHDLVSFILFLIKIECFEIIENGLRVKQESIQNFDLHSTNSRTIAYNGF